MDEPSANYSRTRLGCVSGTSSPSNIPISSTQDLLTYQPSRQITSVISRYPYHPYCPRRHYGPALRGLIAAPAPVRTAPAQRLLGSALRSVLFLRDFLQNNFIHCQIRHHLLQQDVLGGQIPHSLRLIDPQLAMRPSPAKVRLAQHPDLFANRRPRLGLGSQRISLTEIMNDLFARNSLLRYFQISFAPVCGTLTCASNFGSPQMC